MTKPITTNIDGLMCSLEVHPDNGTTQVYINYQEFSGSLEFLMGEGYLMGPRDTEHWPEDSTINEVEAWAASNGYFD